MRPGLGRSPGEWNSHPFQYSGLENPMDRGARRAAVHGVAKSRTQLSDFTFTFHFLALEKGMATHSSILAWRIPWTEEPGRLPSMGSQRVGHDWATKCSRTQNKLFIHGRGGTVLQAWASVFSPHPVEDSSQLSVSSKLCLLTFHSASVGRDGQDFGCNKIEKRLNIPVTSPHTHKDM